MKMYALDRRKARLSLGQSPAEQVLEQLRNLVNENGPAPEDYAPTAELFRQAEKLKISSEQIADVFRDTLVPECIHGFGHLKPHGYAGDFEIIERIYTYWESPLDCLKNWDRFFHAQAAPKAVRNRKAFFKNLLCKLPENANVLNIGSGPGRDLMEFLDENPEQRINIVNMELDPAAVRHSKQLCRHYLHKLEYAQANVFKYKTARKFDLIWSAGLFDYFSDKMFRVAMKRITGWLAPGGRILIGNFSESNNSQAYMELLGKWNLNHRSEADLIRLGVESGLSREFLRVQKEPLGVNLFLEVCSTNFNRKTNC